ncbi:MAG TPA: M48 family metallopeptidase [Terriglobales bacterium]|jgi:Zn-dependent protease with chaperone function|nr:M48 family metallopeptidase [Terriglobales bacterium]
MRAAIFAIFFCLFSFPALCQTPQITEYSLPPAKLEKARALYSLSTKFEIAETAYGFALLIAALLLGVGPKLRTVAERVSTRPWIQGLIIIPILAVAAAILTVPSDAYHHHISLAYGLSIQGWGSWFGDWAKGLLLGIVIETILGSLFYLMIRRSPRRWWFYGWLICLPIILLVVFISPTVIEPIFNKYSPLDQKNPELVTQIERVVKRGGLDIPRSRMFEMAASEKYTGDNAYVTGFGSSKRVVVWDTTEKHMTTPEIMFVFGHEMGHYVLGHVVQGVAFGFALSLIFFYVAYGVSRWMLKRWGTRWQIRDMGDWASLPLLALLMSILFFLGSPIENGFSRHVEHQADTFGLEVMHGLVPDSKQVAAQSFQILGENWLEYPYINDFFEWWSLDHPTTRKRMHYALQYDPWSQGKQPEFVK